MTPSRPAPLQETSHSGCGTALAFETARPAQTPAMNDPHAQAIEKLAHELWIGRGRPEGSPELDWLRAEQMLRIPTLQQKAARSTEAARSARKVVPDDSCDA